MTSISQVLRAAEQDLQAAGVETARLDARLLLAEAMQRDPVQLFNRPDLPVEPLFLQRFLALAERRRQREPLSLILGRREFWSLNFRVTPKTLTPRPDSETLVEAVLAALPDPAHPWRLLDLGTGSGCLLLALLSELPAAQGLGVDRDPDALAIAGENADRLGLAPRARFACSDWCAGIDGCFDVILSNPPYIPTRDIAALDPEVSRYEPLTALDGGPDGLDAYRRLAAECPVHLAANGLLALELGAGQAPAVAALLFAAGFSVREIRRDLAGNERCILAACAGNCRT